MSLHDNISLTISQCQQQDYSNSNFENCQVKVKAEVKENYWNFPYSL
ncbi:MAG: hypothetical protein GTO45_16690 [Candidatus Aminicenantes bacterium]|nr:hypothetical protein [Candidatus Aminicenantes bacterium]NIN19766.1 hypothetical protein [Candidatus Aminicenantes bacterium]NIN43648.1 hypothetical protein [Candidatus Aminicenantes bacterium]NIN86393.1 hypothetical protein [Candidatus Aminicenantes bacterium]NIO82659.1 hypothetical protein [Candidatus Aminicenantes bacterium]